MGAEMDHGRREASGNGPKEPQHGAGGSHSKEQLVLRKAGVASLPSTCIPSF